MHPADKNIVNYAIFDYTIFNEEMIERKNEKSDKSIDKIADCCNKCFKNKNCSDEKSVKSHKKFSHKSNACGVECSRSTVESIDIACEEAARAANKPYIEIHYPGPYGGYRLTYKNESYDPNLFSNLKRV